MSKPNRNIYFSSILLFFLVSISWNGANISDIDKNFYPINFEVQNAYGRDDDLKKFTYNMEELNRNCELSIDEQNNVIYASNPAKNTVIAINGTTHQEISQIPVGKFPCDVEIDPSRNLLYVMNELDWSLSIIDTNEIKLLKSFHLPFIPYELVVSNKTGDLYIVSDKQNALYLVNSKNEQVEKLFDIERPCGIGINQLTNTIYASSETSDLVYVLDGNNNTLTDKVKVGAGPRGITVNENNNTIYIANSKSNSLSLISGDTNTVEKEIKTKEDPRRLIYDDIHNFIYSINLEPGLVTISDPKGILLKSFKIETPNDLGYNSKTDTLYMTNHYENIFYIENIGDLPEYSDFVEDSCRLGLELVYKANNHKPACVFPNSVQKLIDRGWASEIH